MTQLVKYDAARRALAEAHRVDEVKSIRDKAQAMALYARQAKDTAMVEWASEIKVRAEIRAGEMLKVAADNGERDPGGKSKTIESQRASQSIPNLESLGITASQSSRWQKLAGMSPEHREAAIATAKQVAGEVTTAFMLRAAKGADASVTAREVVNDDAVDPLPATQTQSMDEQAAVLYESVRRLSELTATAHQLKAALPEYQHFRIANAIDRALKLLKEVKKIWTS